jgi:hypothetical protein
LSSQGNNLALLLGGSGPFIGKFPGLVLGKGIGHEVVCVDVFSFLVGVHLATNEVSELNIVCCPVSLEQVDQEVTGRISPSRKILDLRLHILIEGLDIGI